jgi:hypothetical protein
MTRHRSPLRFAPHSIRAATVRERCKKLRETHEQRRHFPRESPYCGHRRPGAASRIRIAFGNGDRRGAPPERRHPSRRSRPLQSQSAHANVDPAKPLGGRTSIDRECARSQLVSHLPATPPGRRTPFSRHCDYLGAGYRNGVVCRVGTRKCCDALVSIVSRVGHRRETCEGKVGF